MASRRNIQCFSEKIVKLMFDILNVYIYSNNIKYERLMIQQWNNQVNSLDHESNQDKHMKLGLI